MNAFTSAISPVIESLLRHKRSLGYVYRREEGHLRALDRLARSRDAQQLSEDLVRAYVSGGSVCSRPHRLTVVRQLALFIAMDTPDAYVPPKHFLGIRRIRRPIHILSRDQYARFLDACDRLPGSVRWPERGQIHGLALRTLLLAGLRRGEVLRLKEEDVDFDEGVLRIVNTKFGKSRFVPVAPDLLDRLRGYRDVVLPTLHADRCASDAFFPGPDGRRPAGCKTLYASFRRALALADIAHHGRGYGPRCHDLRHAFAVLRLLSWYEHGDDLATKLPLLATYLGHVELSSVQVYLHVTRDLVGEIVRRQQDRFGDMITAEVTS